MYSFDATVMDYCKTNGFLYSRYADDIYISSECYINKDILVFLNAELNKRELTINNSKTHFSSSKSRRTVTGLVITNERQVSIGTAKRQQIRKIVYEKLVHGTGDSNQILGNLSFLKDIEPNTYNNIIIKYSLYCDGDIIQALRK